MILSPLTPAALAQCAADGWARFAVDLNQLSALAEAAEGHFGAAAPYRFFVTQRGARSDGFSSATESPPARTIRFHNECSYLSGQPTHLLFVCQAADCADGQTLLADTAQVAQTVAQTHPELLEKAFAYHWTLPDASAVGRKLRCEPDEAAERLGALGLDVRTDTKGRLHIRSQRPSIGRGPAGEVYWANHLYALHHTAIDAGLIRLYRRQYDACPHDVTFADDSPIPAEAVAAVGAAYAKHAFTIEWKPGDALLIDNLRFAHGRAPYRGTRDLWVKLLGRTS